MGTGGSARQVTLAQPASASLSADFAEPMDIVAELELQVSIHHIIEHL
jgi:hypothetical protein